VKSLLEVINFNIWLSIELKGFNGQKITLLDPVHEVSELLVFGSNFLNFVVEKTSIGLFDSLSKYTPVFN